MRKLIADHPFVEYQKSMTDFVPTMGPDTRATHTIFSREYCLIRYAPCGSVVR
jgi:hypothetical protein